MTRLLITGGRGFIGRHCAVAAAAAGYEVHATYSAAGASGPPSLPGTTWHRADLLAEGAIEHLIEQVRPTHLLHTAWETTHGAYWTSPANLSWLGLLTKLLPAFAQHGGQRIVSAGSCAEYSWAHEGFMQEDETPELPLSFYGRIKLAHHAVLMAGAEQFGFSASTGRIFFGYGAYENSRRVIPYICRQLIKGEPAMLTSGNFNRDFMHVSDIGAGFVALLGSRLAGACNVSAGTAVSLAQIAIQLGEIAARPDLIRLGALPDRADDPPLLCGDNGRLRSTGWSPCVSLQSGLEETYSWWRYSLMAAS